MILKEFTVGQALDAKPTKHPNNHLVITQDLIDRLVRIESLCRQNKETMTIDDVAIYTGLSKSTLYKHTSLNTIPYYSPSGKKIYFIKREIDDWLTTNRSATNEELIAQAELYANNRRKKH